MNIYVTRHGQTKYNNSSLMQGRTDEPLNAVGEEQAKEVAGELEGISFDAVFASPLKRAVKTASIVSGAREEEIIKDERITEFDFGPYELKPYGHLGWRMTLYWLLPEIFPCPDKVETIPEAKKRVASFFEDLKTKDYTNVLIVCHGGIIRVISGYLEGRRNGIKWRPKPKNCEVRKYELKQ